MEKSNYHSDVDHHKWHMKRSVEKRAFLCAFIISFTICTLFLGWKLVSVLEATQIPPIPVTHTGSSTDVVENLEENALATARRQGDEQEQSLILVNRQNPIPAQYDVELEQLSNGEWIDIRISPHLQDLLDAARTDGAYPIVAPEHRTTEKQQEIMDGKIVEYKAKGYTSAQAKTEAETQVAVPGTSEHQLGLAVDTNADGICSIGNEVYRWPDENSYRFGFTRRYSSDKTEITGVNNESWHYRYVDIEAATEMYNQGVRPEEYLRPEKREKDVILWTEKDWRSVSRSCFQ